MTSNELLKCLAEYTEEAVKDLLLPVSVQRVGEAPTVRPAAVYQMRLPDGRAATKKAPYIIHQVVTRMDRQPQGEQIKSSVQVRTVFCVYCKDEQEGSLMLLTLMERLRICLLRDQVIGKRFILDLETGLEGLVYPDETVPYYVGEMASTWRLPGMIREVRYGNETHNQLGKV